VPTKKKKVVGQFLLGGERATPKKKGAEKREIGPRMSSYDRLPEGLGNKGDNPGRVVRTGGLVVRKKNNQRIRSM